MLQTNREDLLHTAREAVEQAFPEAWIAYLHGSFARGDERPDSDIDIAVLLPPGRTIPDKLSLLHDLSKKMGHDVDVANLREAGLDLVQEVLRHGLPLFNRRPSDSLIWEAERMTDFADFNPRRADILDLYLKQPLRTRP